MFNRKLKAEVVRLTYRVRELEERLCPAQQHTWKKVSYHFDSALNTIYKYQCLRCGKQIESAMILDVEGMRYGNTEQN